MIRWELFILLFWVKHIILFQNKQRNRHHDAQTDTVKLSAT